MNPITVVKLSLLYIFSQNPILQFQNIVRWMMSDGFVRQSKRALMCTVLYCICTTWLFLEEFLIQSFSFGRISNLKMKGR